MGSEARLQMVESFIAQASHLLWYRSKGMGFHAAFPKGSPTWKLGKVLRQKGKQEIKKKKLKGGSR